MSEPTQAALIELSLEEASKALGLLIIFGVNLILKNKNAFIGGSNPRSDSMGIGF